MSHTQSKDIEREQLDRMVGLAPGAVPPTGGTTPEAAPPARARSPYGIDGLIDGLSLTVRAARELDPAQCDAELPQLEMEAEHAITRLQVLESEMDGSEDGLPNRIAAIAAQARHDLLRTLAETIRNVDNALLNNR